MMTIRVPRSHLRRAAATLALALAATSCVKLPNLERTLSGAQRLAESSYILAADGTLITGLHEEQNRDIIAIDQVPTHVQQAVIAVEDERFFDHPGVDLKAIVRAFLRNTAEGKVVEGGSTITQQYIKNALISRGRTLKGKLDEAALAWQLEHKYSKLEILGLYLNTVYFGQGAYGIDAAAQTFFGRHAKDLSVVQGALLAGLIRSPTRYDPYTNPDAAIARRNLVLKNMREQRYLTPKAADAAIRSALGVARAKSATARYPAAHFVEYVKDLIQRDRRFDVLGTTLPERINALFKGGLRIHTTIDLRLQKIAEEASRKVLPFTKDPHNAFVAMDPRTGGILAMVGGRDFFDAKDRYAKFNLAVQARRQPGSSFKTFTLVAALEKGIPLERIYRGGSVITIKLPTGPWVVHNYESLSFGSRLSLREATTKSVNVVYAQVVQEVGAAKVMEVAQRMGITSPLKPLAAISIGAQEVSPLDLASGYSPLANGGYAAPPVAITKITDSSGKVLFDWRYAKRKVLEPQVVALTVDALKDVIAKGTGRRQQLGRPAAGKTGTADNYHDAWFAGMTPQIVGVSWVGFPRAQIPMYPPRTRIKVVGGSWPGQIWKLFMQQALAGQPPMDFPISVSDLVRVRIDVTRNCLPNPFTPPALIKEQVFIKGSEPKAVCTEPTTGAIMAPNVIGKAKAVAIDALQQAGFSVVASSRSCPAYPAGYVCDQSPAPGTIGSVGQSAVVYVSDDSTIANVPMVLGKTLSQARTALQSAGFTVTVTTSENPDGDVGIAGCRDPDETTSGRVWLQAFCAGEQRPKGSAVRIYVNP